MADFFCFQEVKNRLTDSCVDKVMTRVFTYCMLLCIGGGSYDAGGCEINDAGGCGCDIIGGVINGAGSNTLSL